MPDYYKSTLFADGGNATFEFAAEAPPSAVFIDLGTNDRFLVNEGGGESYVNSS